MYGNEFADAGDFEWPQQPFSCRTRSLDDNFGPVRSAHPLHEIVRSRAAITREHVLLQLPRHGLVKLPVLVSYHYLCCKAGRLLRNVAGLHLLSGVGKVT